MRKIEVYGVDGDGVEKRYPGYIPSFDNVEMFVKMARADGDRWVVLKEDGKEVLRVRTLDGAWGYPI